MDSTTSIHFLIVGQGLAGSLLAWELRQRGRRVLVVDPGECNASRVAAGIINPVTGPRLAKTHDVEILLPTALALYAALGAYFGQVFYFDAPMLRLFRSAAEAEQGRKRLQDDGYQEYLARFFPGPTTICEFAAKYGYLVQRQTGYLTTIPLLESLRRLFQTESACLQAEVDYRDFHVSNQHVHWQGVEADQVIFCEGYRAIDNPWFRWLPWQPVKGEMLTVELPLQLPNTLLNAGHWLLPLAKRQARLGATFERGRRDVEATGHGLDQLLLSLKPFLPVLQNASVIQQDAGIRPCTGDRFPFLGKHPQVNRIAIFNGFGAKGSLQIPWYSQRLADFLLADVPLPYSCDIRRFDRHYVAA